VSALASWLVGSSVPPPADAPACSTVFVWGINGHPTQQATYSSEGSLAAQLDYLEQLGVSHYRLDLTVDSMGIVDSFHSGRSVSFDRVLSAAAARHLQLLPVLTRRPDYRATPAANHRAGYLMGLRFAAQYGARLEHIEAGNETEDGALRYNVVVDSLTGVPDTSYWAGTEISHYDPERLTVVISFLDGLVRGIHDAAPHIQIIIDVAGRHYGFFEALQQAGVDFDVYGLHWYSDMDQDAGGFAAVLDALGRPPLRNLPVWVTEVNRREGSHGERAGDDQAMWITRLANDISFHPQVTAFFVYELLDQPAFESSYGLVTCPADQMDPFCLTGRELKPAFDAYRRVIHGCRPSIVRAGLWRTPGSLDAELAGFNEGGTD
jgi:hypothetical protein